MREPCEHGRYRAHRYLGWWNPFPAECPGAGRILPMREAFPEGPVQFVVREDGTWTFERRGWPDRRKQHETSERV